MRRDRFTCRVVFLPIFIAGLTATLAYGAVTQTVSGSSASGDPVSFMAELTIVGDMLTVQLVNTSAVASNSPDDLLCSYYFDIVDNGGDRPALTYVSAAGDVWLTDKSSPDVLQIANANLKAVSAGDDTWEFRTFDAALNPFLGFGVGTVGNGSLAPNNFHGNIVDGFDYSIYAGEVITQSLSNYLLVKPSATFTFSGLTGFTEADIGAIAAFGMGTAPDSLLRTPEPAMCILFALGGLVMLRRR